MNYFWYSNKQQNMCNKINRAENMLVLSSGEWKPYTEWTQTDTPHGKWDDYILVLKAPSPVYIRAQNGPVNTF